MAFACAADGWAFRTDAFAEMYASKLGCSSSALRRGLWGDWFYNPKTRKIVGRKAAGGKLKPLFVQCVLDPIWKLYKVAEAERHGYPPEGGKDLAAMAASLKVDVAEKDLKSADRKTALEAVMKAWLPLSPAILEMVAHRLPSPTGSSKRRVHRLMPAPTLKQTLAADDAAALAASRKAVSRCDASEGSSHRFHQQMLAVPASAVHGKSTERQWGRLFLGFGRVYWARSEGDVVRDQRRVEEPDTAPAEIAVEELYLMMGQGMFRVKEVPAEISSPSVDWTGTC